MLCSIVRYYATRVTLARRVYNGEIPEEKGRRVATRKLATAKYH